MPKTLAPSLAIPVLTSARLKLRGFELADAPALAAICDDRAVAAMTDSIPHPYDITMAEQFIREQGPALEANTQFVFAVCLASDGSLIGDCGVYSINQTHRRADLGVVIDRKHWSRGYGTEAMRAVIAFGFQTLELHRLDSGCFAENHASARMLEKCGMKREGIWREAYLKWGRWQDEVRFGLLRSEWSATR